MKLPRKKKKKIPYGMYCYTPKEAPSEKTNWSYLITSCPFYKHVEGLEGYCKFLNSEITDQIKDCGIKKP